MTKRQVDADFKEVTRGIPRRDKPALREAWAIHIDSLERCGAITTRQAETWLPPAWVERSVRR